MPVVLLISALGVRLETVTQPQLARAAALSFVAGVDGFTRAATQRDT